MGRGQLRSGDPGLGASLFDRQARGLRRLDGSGHCACCLEAGEAGFFGQGSWTEHMLLEHGWGGLAESAGSEKRRITTHA